MPTQTALPDASSKTLRWQAQWIEELSTKVIMQEM
jgi:hypothetical protein